MAGQEYLIDTNIVIEYIGGTLPETTLDIIDDIIDNCFYISVINKIELLGFADITEDEEQKFLLFINAANIIKLDDEVVNATIQLRKKYKIKLPDAIIAATALVNDLTILTRNTKDFEKIVELQVVSS